MFLTLMDFPTVEQERFAGSSQKLLEIVATWRDSILFQLKPQVIVDDARSELAGRNGELHFVFA